MKRIASLLDKLASPWVLLTTCVVFFSFPFYFLPQHKANTAGYSGDAGFIDLCFFPKPDRIYEIAAAYGKEGRKVAIRSWFTLDIIWPLVYSLFFLVCINLSLGYSHGRKAALLSLFALLPMVFDFCENMLGVLIMSAYPDRMNFTALYMSLANGLKWLSFGLVGCLFVYGLVAAPVRALKGKHK